MSTEPRHKITIGLGERKESLRTVQADTHEEFVEEVKKAIESLQVCYDLMLAGKAVTNLVETPAPVQAQATAQPAPAAPAAPAAFTEASVPQCPHGPMTPRSGSGAKGPWKAWFCPTPKGTPDQCVKPVSPQWVTRGTPEWNNFPA